MSKRFAAILTIV